MNKFMSAMKSYDAITANGAVAHSTSGSELVDFFYAIGSVRGIPHLAVSSFRAAAAVDRLAALKILFHMRNPRGGQGEREATRAVLRSLAGDSDFHNSLKINMHLIPQFGRWDDLLVFYGTPLWDHAVRIIGTALSFDDCYLVAKWMPRKGEIADSLRQAMGLTQRGYRKILSTAPATVERKMSAKAFGEIDYSGVPSRAAKIYRRAFMRNDSGRYADYLSSLDKGEAKVNSSALFPYEIVSSLSNRFDVKDILLDAMWKALPNWVTPGKSIIPLCDVSGSMAFNVLKGAKKATALDVSISLGIYLAERNVGPWKDQLISFTDEPKFFSLKGQTLGKKVHEVASRVGYNTDFVAVFKKILQHAKRLKLSPEDMPDTIVVFSDMQFDQANRLQSEGAYTKPDAQSVWETAKGLYEGTGYNPPKMVFWNICSPTLTLPAKSDEDGIVLMGGFSPSLLQAVTTGDISSSSMLDLAVLKNPLYDQVR